LYLSNEVGFAFLRAQFKAYWLISAHLDPTSSSSWKLAVLFPAAVYIDYLDKSFAFISLAPISYLPVSNSFNLT
jgi:hypothetical protein